MFLLIDTFTKGSFQCCYYLRISSINIINICQSPIIGALLFSYLSLKVKDSPILLLEYQRLIECM
jgi:hypothetical protein